MPKVSIIMTSFNSEKYLNECILSILNQSFKDFEFIISDGFSNDKTIEIIDDYSKIDSRMIFLKNFEKRGIVDCLTDCLKISKGEFIAIMESDDVAELNRIEESITFLEKNKNIGFIGSYGNIIDGNGNKIGKIEFPTDLKEIKNDILVYNPFMNPTAVVRKSVINELGFYDKKFDVIQDYEYWMRLIINGIEGVNLPKFLLNYRMHENNTSKIKGLYIIKKNKELRKKYMKQFNLKISLKNKKRIFIEEMYVQFIHSKLYTVLNKFGLCNPLIKILKKILG